jgi:hypothetical protein
MKFTFILLLTLSSIQAFAQDLNSAGQVTVGTLQSKWWEKIKNNLGSNYNSFLDGPGVFNKDQSITPNAI